MECKAYTNQGNQCSRKTYQNYKYCWQHQNYEKRLTLSSDILQYIAEFLNLADMIKLKIIGFANIKFLGSCIIIKNPSYEKLQKLYEIGNKIKDLTLVKSTVTTDFISTKNNVFDLAPFLNFKKLEALALIFPTAIRANWNILKNLTNLKYLDIAKFDKFFTFYETNLAISHLKISHYTNVIRNENNLMQNLQTLEIDGSDPEILSYFPDLKRIIFYNENFSFYYKLTELQNLEALEILNTIHLAHWIDEINIDDFPSNLRYLEINENFLYSIALRTPQGGEEYLKLNKLEYLSINSSTTIKDLNLPLPSLKHLHIKNLFGKDLNNLLQFSENKNITLDFDVLSFDNKTYIEDEKNWEIVKHKFQLSNLYEKDKFYYLVSHTYTKIDWLLENGYYIKENCGYTNS